MANRRASSTASRRGSALAGPSTRRNDLLVFKGVRYLGAIETTSTTGAGVDIDEIAAKMLERGTPEKIQLEIHATALILRRKKGDEILAKVPSAMITWASQTRESIVVFLDTCSSPPLLHGFYPKAKADEVYRFFMHKLGIGERMARWAVGQEDTEAQQAAQAVLSTAMFDAFLLGQVSYQDDLELQGIQNAYQICKIKLKRAWEKAIGRRKAKDAPDSAVQQAMRGNPVHLTISNDGLRALDGSTRTVLATVFVGDVMMAANFNDDEAGQSVIGVVVRNTQLAHRACYLFSGTKGQSEAIADRLRQVCEAFQQDTSNPFAAEGSVAEAPQDINPALMARTAERECLVPVACLGLGKFGRVHVAAFVPNLLDASPEAIVEQLGDGALVKELVSVTMLKTDATPSEKAAFLHEADICIRFSHPNVAGVAAVGLMAYPWLIARQHGIYGSLQAVTMACRARAVAIPVGEVASFSHQIASAMQHVAEKGIVMMNLTAESVELGVNNHLFLSDFSSARSHDVGSRKHVLRSRLRLNLRWLATETFTQDEKVFSEASDVWSFAVTVWTLLSGQTPYQRYRLADLQRKIPNGLRLPKPAECDEELFALLTACWSADPELRPPFLSVVNALAKLVQDQPTSGRPGLGERLNADLSDERDAAAAEKIQAAAQLMQDLHTEQSRMAARKGTFGRSSSDIALGQLRRHNPLFGTDVDTLWELDSDNAEDADEDAASSKLELAPDVVASSDYNDGYGTDPYDSDEEASIGSVSTAPQDTSTASVNMGAGLGRIRMNPRPKEG